MLGSEFGRLTVEAQAPTQNEKRRWVCRCACGTTVEVTTNNLRAGHTKSCGCLRYASKRGSIAERFWNRVDRRGPDECWPWTGGTDQRGYGKLWVDGKKTRATHVSWALRHGLQFPDNMIACHSCDNPRCVNPDHIFVGTQKDNILDAITKGRHRMPIDRGWQSRKTRCKRGHEFAGANLIVDSHGYRQCRTCHNERSRRSAYRAETPTPEGADDE